MHVPVLTAVASWTTVDHSFAPLVLSACSPQARLAVESSPGSFITRYYTLRLTSAAARWREKREEEETAAHIAESESSSSSLQAAVCDRYMGNDVVSRERNCFNAQCYCGSLLLGSEQPGAHCGSRDIESSLIRVVTLPHKRSPPILYAPFNWWLERPFEGNSLVSVELHCRDTLPFRRDGERKRKRYKNSGNDSVTLSGRVRITALHICGSGKCGKTTAPVDQQAAEEEEEWNTPLQHFWNLSCQSSLRTLTLSRLSMLTALTLEALLRHSPFLEELCVDSCSALLSVSGLEYLPRLTYLRLCGQTCVQHLGGLGACHSLRSLVIMGDHQLTEGNIARYFHSSSAVPGNDVDNGNGNNVFGRVPLPSLRTVHINSRDLDALRPLLSCLVYTIEDLTVLSTNVETFPLPLHGDADYTVRTLNLPRSTTRTNLSGLCPRGLHERSPWETTLTRVSLTGCRQLHDITALAALHALEWLDLSWSAVESLEPLRDPACCRALHTLLVRHCARLNSLSAIAHRRCLRALSAEGCVSLVSETLVVPPSMEVITVTHAYDVWAVGLSSLEGTGRSFHPLRVVVLDNTSLYDLTPFQSATQLTALSLASCAELTDVSPLETLLRLRILVLCGTSVAAVGGPPSLEVLNLSGSLTEEPFRGLCGPFPLLRRLSLARNRSPSFCSLDFLSYLRKEGTQCCLEILNVSECSGICDFSPIARYLASSLQVLELDGNTQIEDLRCLSGSEEGPPLRFPCLRELSLDRCPFEPDIALLRALAPKLRTLRTSGMTVDMLLLQHKS